MKFRRGLLAVVLGALLLVSACGGAGTSNQQGSGEDSKGDVHIVYVEWVCATASTHVLAEVLRSKMGYNVILTPVSAALMFEALAQGEADFCTTVWLPVSHAYYMARVGDRVDNVSISATGARIGLAVPAYVEIDSIEELNSIRNELDGEIIGIDPGAGMMGLTLQIIDEYGLDLTLVEGSDATMTAMLKNAIDNNRPVVVTAWRPHWKFSRWDLRMLDEPKKIFGEDENIHTIARLGLREDMPEVYELLQNFHWSIDDLDEAVMMAEEYGDNVRAAADWVANNLDLVNSWLPEAYR